MTADLTSIVEVSHRNCHVTLLISQPAVTTIQLIAQQMEIVVVFYAVIHNLLMTTDGLNQDKRRTPNIPVSSKANEHYRVQTIMDAAVIYLIT